MAVVNTVSAVFRVSGVPAKVARIPATTATIAIASAVDTKMPIRARSSVINTSVRPLCPAPVSTAPVRPPAALLPAVTTALLAVIRTTPAERWRVSRGCADFFGAAAPSTPGDPEARTYTGATDSMRRHTDDASRVVALSRALPRRRHLPRHRAARASSSVGSARLDRPLSRVSHC